MLNVCVYACAGTDLLMQTKAAEIHKNTRGLYIVLAQAYTVGSPPPFCKSEEHALGLKLL